MIRDIEDTIRRLNQAKTERKTWESHWQEIGDFMVPRKNDFNHFQQPGSKRNAPILDNTGMQSVELLAGTLHGMLLNPAQIFFELTSGDPAIDQKDPVRIWLEDTALRIFNTMHNSNFQTEAHEFLIDLVAFNTANMLVLEDNEFDVIFQAHFLKEIYIWENSRGLVDEIYRCFEWDARKIVGEFGKANLDQSIIDAFEQNRETKFELAHVMYPVDDYGPRKVKNFKFKIVSQYIDIKNKKELRLKGYNEMPWPVARWSKASGEVYGRGPGMNALPEVKMANLMEDIMIRGAQKVIDPPLQVPDDGFVLPIKTRPGGINVRRAGAGRSDSEIKPIFNTAQINFGDVMMKDRRARIQQAFYLDQFQTPQLDRQTATEVSQRADEQLRFLGPLVGRLSVEFLRPLIERVFAVMSRKPNRFLPPPPELRGKFLTVRYSSPIAKIQRMSEAKNMFQTFQMIGPVISFDPSITDNFDGDAYTRGIATDLSFPQKYLRNVADRDKMRAAKAKAQAEQAQQQQQMQQAEIASKAVPAAAQAAQVQKDDQLEGI